MFKYLLLLIAAVLFVSCSNSVAPSYGLDEEFSLRVGNSVVINNDYKLSFIDVTEDSRCPINAMCIWEGEAVLKLAVQDNKTRQSFFISSNRNSPYGKQNNYRNGSNIYGYIYEILAVEPYPELEKNIDNSKYVIKLKITDGD